MTMLRLYSRCNSGHYFEGTHCPADGWSARTSVEIATARETLLKRSEAPSIAALRALGVSEEAIGRSIVVEFGDANSAFEMIAPEGYFAGGTWIPNSRFDSRFI
jgi:hypothetical protein